MSDVDIIVKDDLHLLAAATGHPRAAEPPVGGAFRDARTYALALRAKELVARAGDLADAYGAVPVYAARIGRIAASAVAAVVALLAFAPEPDHPMAWQGFVVVLPWLSIFAYAVASTWGKRRFRRAVRNAPAGAVDHARTLVARTDGWAVGTIVAAITTTITTFCYLVACARFDPYSSGAEIARVVLAPADVYTGIALAGVAALVIASALAREGGARWSARLASIPAGAAGAAILIVALRYFAYELELVERTGTPTTSLTSSIVAAGVALGSLLVGACIALRVRAREQKKLAT